MRRGSSVLDTPFHVTLPLSGRSTSRQTRIVVVFPAPFAPRNPKTSPGPTEKLTPSSARTVPNVLTRESMTSVTARD